MEPQSFTPEYLEQLQADAFEAYYEQYSDWAHGEPSEVYGE